MTAVYLPSVHDKRVQGEGKRVTLSARRKGNAGVMQIPTYMLWIGLLPTAVLVLFIVNYLAGTLKSGQIGFAGRVLFDKKKHPMIFWALLADGVLIGGLACAGLIAVIVELFLVRA
jgi:hypothetical protein